MDNMQIFDCHENAMVFQNGSRSLQLATKYRFFVALSRSTHHANGIDSLRWIDSLKGDRTSCIADDSAIDTTIG
jgi:hypothetical protein